jgi:hypothetical protein
VSHDPADAVRYAGFASALPTSRPARPLIVGYSCDSVVSREQPVGPVHTKGMNFTDTPEAIIEIPARLDAAWCRDGCNRPRQGAYTVADLDQALQQSGGRRPRGGSPRDAGRKRTVAAVSRSSRFDLGSSR